MQTLQKTFELCKQAPDLAPGDLEIINQFALEPLTAEEVYARPMLLANDQVDRDFEKFSAGVLAQFAQTLPGKSVLMGHRRDGEPEGLFYKAEVVPGDGQLDLKAWFYMPKTPQNQGLIQKLAAGVLRYVSIGFRAEALTCDICGKPAGTYGWVDGESPCPHVMGREYEGVTATATWSGTAEAVEGSIVFLGSQYGAEVVAKSPDVGDTHTREELFIAAGKLATRRGMPELSDDAQADAWARIRALYAKAGLGQPEELQHGAKFSWDIFHEDERDVCEEAWFHEDVTRATGTIVGCKDFALGLGEKVGRVLSARNLEKVQAALDALQALLDAAVQEESADGDGGKDADRPVSILSLMAQQREAEANHSRAMARLYGNGE